MIMTGTSFKLKAAAAIATPLCIIVMSSSACAAIKSNDGSGEIKPADQSIDFQIENKMDWKGTNPAFDHDGFSIVYIPTNQNQSNWTESFRYNIIPYQNHPGIDAKKLRQLELSDAKKYCARVKSTIISQSKSFITYTMNVYLCDGGEPDQSQMVKAFNGKHAVYAIHYSSINNAIVSAVKSKHQKSIKNARLLDIKQN